MRKVILLTGEKGNKFVFASKTTADLEKYVGGPYRKLADRFVKKSISQLFDIHISVYAGSELPKETRLEFLKPTKNYSWHKIMKMDLYAQSEFYDGVGLTFATRKNFQDVRIGDLDIFKARKTYDDENPPIRVILLDPEKSSMEYCTITTRYLLKWMRIDPIEDRAHKVDSKFLKPSMAKTFELCMNKKSIGRMDTSDRVKFQFNVHLAEIVSDGTFISQEIDPNSGRAFVIRKGFKNVEDGDIELLRQSERSKVISVPFHAPKSTIPECELSEDRAKAILLVTSSLLYGFKYGVGDKRKRPEEEVEEGPAKQKIKL